MACKRISTSEIKIVPLSEENVNEAIRMALRTFDTGKEEFDYAPRWFKASLAPKKHKAEYGKFGVTWLKYWVAIEPKSKKVVGSTGLYLNKKDEKDAYWLGWFGVDPNFRRRGVGRKLLEFSIARARKDGKKYLRLYTSRLPSEANAQILYEKMGFKETGEGKRPDIGIRVTMVYRELKLF